MLSSIALLVSRLSRTAVIAHMMPEASASQSPILRGKGRPESRPKIVTMPTRPSAMASQRTGVIVSPSTTRPSNVLQIGVR